MLWYNNPDSVEAIRASRLEHRSTIPKRGMHLVRTVDDQAH